MVGTTKAISTYFPPGGIADRMISFNGFPFLDTKEEHTFHVPVSTTMTPVTSLTFLPATGLTLSSVSSILGNTAYSGFPVISDSSSRLLLGYIGRTELTYAISKAQSTRLLSPDAKCFFDPSSSAHPTSAASSPASAQVPPVTFDAIASDSGRQTIDFARFVDPTPLTVHPRLPLETTMELFKKMGPRVILVEHKGRLSGLITVKDCLKYQFQVEAQERGEAVDGREERLERWIWGAIKGSMTWTGEKLGRWTGGKIRLGGEGRLGEGARAGLLVGDSVDPRDERGSILEGTEDDIDADEGPSGNVGVELQER